MAIKNPASAATRAAQKKEFKGDILRFGNPGSRVASLLLSTLAINILSLGLPIMTTQIYDRVLPNPGTGTLPVLIAGVCLAVVLETFLRLCRSYVLSRAGASYEHGMACHAMKCVLNADFAQMGKYGIGEHLHRMGAVGKLKDFYNGYSLITIVELVFVPLFFGIIWYIAGPLALVPAVILCVFTAVSVWKGYRLRAALKSREKVDDTRFNFLVEALEGIHTLKAFALEKFFERRYERLEEQSCIENYRVTQETAGAFNAGAIFSHIMVAAVISVGAIQVLNGHLTTGGLIAVLLLSGRMMQPAQKALALWTKYQDYTLAREKLTELLSTPQADFGDLGLAGTDLPSDGRLDIENVSFRYGQDGEYIVKDVNLHIRRGEAILLTGGHGAGKSTLLSLVAGVYRPTSGDIFLDGENIKSYAPQALPRHVGYIRANDIIFRGTIRENITCFGQTDEAMAREIATLLGVDKEVARLPGGFDTFLTGTTADSIPPGLRHRIAIVRVLASKPRLVIFDNADRLLDKDSYSMIYNLLARLKGKASMIIVSDDNNICALADRVYDLDKSVLSDAGNASVKTNVRPYRELRL